jgi:hypothetical protein
MSGGLRQAWQYLASELWERLADYSQKDAAAPPDLFSDLFAAADDFLAPRATDTELEEVRNDPQKARQRFLSLKGTDFASEAAIVHFIEEAQIVIADYDLPGFDDYYRRLLREVLIKFNLRYRIEDPFTLRFLLSGSFANLYTELHRLNSNDSHLSNLWNDFEAAFDHYARTQGDSELRTSIAKTSNYLEGLASATIGKPGTLGKLCDDLTDWPHEKVKDAVKSLYAFCSDYPGIRHAGTPSRRKRQLDRRDSVAINLSLVALAAYLSKGLDQGEMLGFGAGVTNRSRVVVAHQQPTSQVGFIRRLLSSIGFDTSR